MAQMLCRRHKAPVEMFRVVNPPGMKDFPQGSSLARCSNCSRIVDCAYCPKCDNKQCVPCYNKSVKRLEDEKKKDPKDRKPTAGIGEGTGL